MAEGGKKLVLPGLEDLVEEETEDTPVDPFPFDPVEPRSPSPERSVLGGRSGYTAGDQSKAMDGAQERAQERRRESGEKPPGQTSDKGS